MEFQSEIEERQSIVPFVPKPSYPKNTVGIEKEQKEVINLLNMTPEDEPPLIVVIYGCGGMGKTTLAAAVVSKLDLQGYNYARVLLDGDERKNDIKRMQEIILRDAFPGFNSGNPIELRDPQEGQCHLQEAFLLAQNDPVFLFIDNALRSQDLRDLLPGDLSDLPKNSKILVTTRTLDTTSIFQTSGIKCCSFAMKTLEDNHAVEILCKDPESRELIKDDMVRILRICRGVPLVLRIVGCHLATMGYNARNCSQIIEASEQGDCVKEEDLTQSLIHFVISKLEDRIKDAFFDICWFFNGCIRQHVEYVVGAEEVQLLEEAALVTSFVDDYNSTEDILNAGDKRLNVHDSVRAEGRAISAPTRFTDVQSFKEAARDEETLKEIKGLWFEDMSYKDVKAFIENLVKHINLSRHSLRILHLGDSIRRRILELEKSENLMKLEEFDMLHMYVGPTPSNGICMSKLPRCR